MAKLGSGSVVTALTAGALAVVTLLAVQAKSSASVATASAPGGKVPAATASAGHASGTAVKPPAVPAKSGTGKRVVYSLGQKRVWLVDPADAGADRTFTVQPGTIDPTTGTYAVTETIAGPYLGSDGKMVKNAVFFTHHDGTPIAFSSAVDGSTPAPDPAKHLGGIRETLADGQALYDFAPSGTKVVVVA